MVQGEGGWVHRFARASIAAVGAVAAVATVVMAGGCSDTTLISEDAEIDVVWDESRGYPDILRFGGVTTGTADEATVTIRSVGADRLLVHDVYLVDGVVELVEDGSTMVLEAGDDAPVTVRFTPYHQATVTDTMAVASAATGEPIQVPIEASGVGDPIPDIEVDPPGADLGLCDLGQQSSRTLTVSNQGYAPLTLAAVTLDGADPDSFSVEPSEVVSVVLQPGDEFPLEVVFAPTGYRPFEADLVVSSDDPDEPSLALPLLGEGWTDAGDGPRAVCAVDPPAVAPGEAATWIGHDSFDTTNMPLTTYVWELIEVPTGSATVLPDCSTAAPDCGPFVPDVGGSYTAELTVRSMADQEHSCQATLAVVPSAGLWVELSWGEPLDDLDLHLVRPAGYAWTDDDCYWHTCLGSGPDWGEAGEVTDDPLLSSDDVTGVGPELIGIERPGDGLYGVFVHDMSGSNLDQPGGDPWDDNAAIVTVYLDGQLVFSDTVILSAEDAEIWVCTIDLPDAVVSPW